MTHQELARAVCDRAIFILAPDKSRKLKFKPMRRRERLLGKNYAIGRTNLKTGMISLDLYTPKKRSPKKLAAILRVLCHEVAHHQKPPYQQRFRGRIISRQHYPDFYRQVNLNIKKLKNHKETAIFFN